MPRSAKLVPWPMPVADALGLLESAASFALPPLRITTPLLMVSVVLLARVVLAEAPGTATKPLTNDCALALPNSDDAGLLAPGVGSSPAVRTMFPTAVR